MKYIKTLLILLFTCSLSLGQGIKFEHVNFEEAIKIAKEKNKKVFVDCYTQWCGPCRMMANKVFNQKKAGVFFNDKFISIKIDCETPYGRKFQDKNKVNSYPTMIIFDNSGDEINRIIGAQNNIDIFIDIVKESMLDESEYKIALKKYRKGERNLDFIADLLIAGYKEIFIVKSDERKELIIELNDIYYWYTFVKRDINELLNHKDFKIISMYAASEPKYYDFVYENLEKFQKIAKENEVNEYIKNTTYKLIDKYYKLGNDKYKEYIERFNEKLISLYKEEPYTYVITKLIYKSKDALEHKKDFELFMKYSFESLKEVKKYKKDFQELEANLCSEIIITASLNYDLASTKQIKELLIIGERILKKNKKNININFALINIYEKDVEKYKKQLINCYKAMVENSESNASFKRLIPMYEKKLKELQEHR